MSGYEKSRGDLGLGSRMKTSEDDLVSRKSCDDFGDRKDLGSRKLCEDFKDGEGLGDIEFFLI